MPDFRIGLAISLAEGSMSSKRLFLEPTIGDKAVVNRALKHAIPQKALDLVAADRSLVLDLGSTTQLFARQLRTHSGWTILTSGLNIVEALWGCTQHTIILPGGTLRFEARALTGRILEVSLQNMRLDTVYFGADSINPVPLIRPRSGRQGCTGSAISIRSTLSSRTTIFPMTSPQSCANRGSTG